MASARAGYGETAAVRGKVRDDYERFDQKYNLMLRGFWDETMDVSFRDLQKGLITNINKRAKGYSRNDWAYLFASSAMLNALDCNINLSNAGSSSWSPVDRRIEGSPHPDMELPDWTGDAAANTRIIKDIAVKFGASDVGVCMLDRRWVYSRYFNKEKNESFPIRFSDEPGYGGITEPGMLADGTQVIPEGMRYVIVFVYEMHYDEIAVAARLVHNAETTRVYSEMAAHTLSVSEFIRGLGYRAIPAINDTMQSVPAAIDAGLGEPSRMGKLIHRKYGPRCRIAKIITDLPLVPDKPAAFGVQAFCAACMKCAKRCPAKAISFGEKTYEPFGDYANRGVLQWPIDHVKCKHMWNRFGNNCGICIQSCPFNKPGNTAPVRFAKWVVSKTPAFNRLFVALDDRLGYGKIGSSEDFWNRLADKK